MRADRLEWAFEEDIRFEHVVTHVMVSTGARVARFSQVDMHVRHAHHDALEFADGTIVPLTRLVAGQRATVLQLPSVPLHEREPEAVARPAAEILT